MTEPATATSEPASTSEPVPEPAPRSAAVPGTARDTAEARVTAEARDTAEARHGWLAVATLAWLLLSLLVSRPAFTGRTVDFNLALAAVALPGLVQASLVVGVAVAMWAVAVSSARVPAFADGWRRHVTGVLAGLLTGAVGTAVALFVYGVPTAAAGVLALTVGLSGGLGGAIGSLRAVSMLRAAVPAALAVIIIGFAANNFSEQLLNLFGDDGTAAGRYAANGYAAFAISLTAGLAAGLVAFWRLRRVSGQAGEAPRWPSYLLAGGAAGLMMFLAELFTRIGAPRLLSLATEDATGDQLVESMAAGSRLNTALVVFFIGAITSMIAFGRKLPKPTS